VYRFADERACMPRLSGRIALARSRRAPRADPPLPGRSAAFANGPVPRAARNGMAATPRGRYHRGGSPPRDPTMLVNCAAYQDGKKLGDIAIEDISEYVHRPDCFVWVALFQPTPEELDQMALEFDLHPLAVEDARKGHQRPKIEEYDDSLFVVLQSIESASEASDDDLLVGEIDVFAGRNYILSVRHRTQKSFVDVRARCEREPELLRVGSGFVLYAIMDAIVDRYFPILEDLESSLEAAESRLFDGSSTQDRIEELYGLKRRLMTLKHATAPLMEAVGKLYGGRVPQMAVGAKEYFRDVYDHLSRINAAIENIREMLATAITVNIAMISLSDNQVTKRLAAWGALITVPTLIAGVYGMNFTHMPELKWALGYPVALLTMSGIDLFLFWRFRRAKWL
jgi:magnesium transporter